MKRILLIMLCTIPIIVFSQSLDDKGTSIGLYMRDSQGLKAVIPSVVSDKNVDAFFLPLFEKPSMSIYVDGGISQNTTKESKPEFFFFMPDRESTNPLTVLDVEQIIKNYPFLYAKSADDFVLVRLFDMKRGRAFRLEKEKVLYGMRFKPFKEDKIDYTIIPMAEGNYKVELKNALPKGEYGFIYNRPSPYDMIIYDFKVE